MKRILLLAAVCCCSFVNAQLIDRNDIIIHAGIGIGIYHYQFTDLQTNISNPRDTSASVQYPMQIEYGVNRWLSGGLCFNYQHFVTDSALNEKATVIDLGIAANFHIPWGLEKFDMTGNIGYGYSRFKYTVEDLDGWQALANGGVLFFGINPRFYFSSNQHLGMELWYRHTAHLYKKGEVTNNSGFVYDFKLDGPGNSFALGFFYKI